MTYGCLLECVCDQLILPIYVLITIFVFTNECLNMLTWVRCYNVYVISLPDATLCYKNILRVKL